MATTSKTRQAMSDEDLGTLMALIKDADSVELKLTVPEADHRSTVVALGADALDSQIRQVIFFDTPDLTLQQHGLVVRARRVQRKGDDSVVKLRPVVPKELPPEVRTSDNFGVEVDALPGGFVCSGSMKAALATGSVRAVMLGDQPIRKLFSKEQRRFYKAHAPDGLELDDLSVLGPIFVLKLKFTPEGFSRPLVGGDVAVPGRLTPARALDQVPPERGVPGRGRGSRSSSPARESTSSASSRRRPGRRSTSSQSTCRRKRRRRRRPEADRPVRLPVRVWIVHAVAAGDRVPVSVAAGRAGREVLDRSDLDPLAAFRALVGAGADVAARRYLLSH